MLPTLLPYLVDEEKAADYFSHKRWPQGVTCPYCGNEDITERERSANGFQRYNCPYCAAKAGQQYLTFTAWTDTVYEGSKIKPTIWLLVIALWQLKLNATEIAQAAGLNQQSAQRCINLLNGSIYETYHLDPSRQLEGQVEADECYQTAGHKGQPRRVQQEKRAGRKRVLKRRGRTTAAQGRPPLLGLVQRPEPQQDIQPAQLYLEVLPNVQTATLQPIITAKIKTGSQLLTDEYNIYNFAQQADDDHRTVNHSAGEYARCDPDGTKVHCNTMEGVWSGLRTFLRRFGGISQKFLHLRVARYEFLHNHHHLSWPDIFDTALKRIFSATAGYWRQMVKKHRPIPLTACYR